MRKLSLVAMLIALPLYLIADDRPSAPPTGKDAAPDAPSKNAVAEPLETIVSVYIKNVELTEAIQSLAQLARTNIVIDQRGLDEQGIRPSELVSLNASGVSLKTCLNLLLEPRFLACTTSEGVITVTSRQRANGPFVTKTYAVADMTGTKAGDRTEWNAAKAESLRELIQATISPESWSEVGGPGSSRLFEGTKSIVVRQTQGVHHEIEALLDKLRSQQ